jgi:hypothetical protein
MPIKGRNKGGKRVVRKRSRPNFQFWLLVALGGELGQRTLEEREGTILDFHLDTIELVEAWRDIQKVENDGGLGT